MSPTIELPVLDLESPAPDLAKQLVSAVSKFGFVYVKTQGSGLSSEEVDAMFDISRDFFACPTEEKEEFRVGSKVSGKNSGWFGMNRETLDPGRQRKGDFKECFNISEFRTPTPQQPLPPTLASHASEINAFVTKCHALCVRLLELFAIGLNIDPNAGGKDWFTPHHDRSRGASGSVFRLLYYPHVPASNADCDPATDVRAGAHSDYGTITLLFQRDGQPGLEVLVDSSSRGRGDGESDDGVQVSGVGDVAAAEPRKWLAVPVNPTHERDLPVLVNVGDLLCHWTNGLLKSAVHRVVFPKEGEAKDRYSIAYFCHPVDHARLVPVPSEMVRSRGVRGQERGEGDLNRRVVTAKEHLESRLAATYG